MEISGQPQVEPPVMTQGSDSSFELDYLKAMTEGRAVKRFNRVGKFRISQWAKPEDSIHSLGLEVPVTRPQEGQDPAAPGPEVAFCHLTLTSSPPEALTQNESLYLVVDRFPPLLNTLISPSSETSQTRKRHNGKQIGYKNYHASSDTALRNARRPKWSGLSSSVRDLQPDAASPSIGRIR